MRRILRENRRTLVGVALVAAPLLVTAVGGWNRVLPPLEVVAVILAFLLFLKAAAIFLGVGIRLVR